jgi:hypothetical protein
MFAFVIATANADHNEIKENDVQRTHNTLKTIKNNGYSWDEEQYLRLRLKVISQYGINEAGRNIVMDGNDNGSEVSGAKVKEEIERLTTILNPPVVEETTTEVETTTTTESYSSSGGYAIPESIVQCESGGDYSAVNPSSGAYGAYQIMPETAANYGCDLSTPQGQDACAAEIYSDVGSGAWVC